VPVTNRALVLGGGGVTGVAWELGILAGLAQRGVDLGTADLVVGTSAGSVVGAQLASGLPVAELYEAQLAGPGAEVAKRLTRATLARMLWAVLGRTPQAARRRLGKLALTAQTEPEEARRAIIESRLPVHDWPAGPRLVITAVDTATGEYAAFDSDSGVPLVDAVAASCAVPGVWPPVTIHGRRWMDGGMRSPVNADLAAGYDRIVVLAPLPRGLGPLTGVARQVAHLAQDSRVVVVSPDAAARAAIGRDVLDPARRAAAARAGLAQSATVVADVAKVWAD
jgi:NTE family protein